MDRFSKSLYEIGLVIFNKVLCVRVGKLAYPEAHFAIRLCSGLTVFFMIFTWRLALLFCTLGLLQHVPARGQTSSDTTEHEEGIHKTRLMVVAGTGGVIYVGGLLYLSEIWYADRQRVPFQFYNDNAGWLQMDKVAHGYVAYHQSYWAYQALRWAGISKRKALWYGGPVGFLMQLPIEIFDGMYEGYGFSWGDVAANTAGSALFMGQQLAWDEQRISFKFSFSPSPYADLRPVTLGRTLGAQLVQDYNAQTYWLSFSPGRFFRQSRWPDWLCLSVGYSGEGMLAEFENPRFIGGQSVQHITRYRQYLLSIDIDTRKIHTRYKLLNGLLHALNMVKIPAPTIEFNRRDKIAFRPLYF
jgi:uncharacterized protein YfiM (DUF2279 family)